MWDWLKFIWTKMSPFFADFAKTSSAALALNLVDLAEAAIAEVSRENWSNTTKREAALAKIKYAALKEGREFSETAGLLAIQMVYAIFKDLVK